jgi:predicted acyl esterase
MIPMRDGARLHTLIYAPKNVGRLPFVIERSPYGWTGKKPDNVLAGRYKEMADEGFIFVFQDIRGRYQSDGTFVMQRPLRDPAVRNRSTKARTPTTQSSGF